jgi:hypothetical protein
LILSILLLAAIAVPPPAPQSGADQGIVVTGQKDERKAVQAFVKALTPTESGGQLSRFEHEVCPAVYGLARPQADAVADRIRLVAKTVGIVVGKPDCAPNVLVVATTDRNAFLEQLRNHRADDFGITDSQIRNLEREPGPAAVWQVQGPPMSADGSDLYVDPGTGFMTNKTIEPTGRITEAVRPQFDGAMVVIDRKALADLTVTQLADYAAIRALTGADPARLGNSGAPTILHVLEVPPGGEAPVTMTSWDLSFLKGYYDAQRNLHTSAQRSAITNSMTKDLKRPQP